MLKLYGFPVSNYTNMVELVLLEKGIPYEYVLTLPGQNPHVQAIAARRDQAMAAFIAARQAQSKQTQ